MNHNRIVRIAIVYDGAYFKRINEYFLHENHRHARLNFSALHDYLVARVANIEQCEISRCQLVDAMLFRGRLSAQKAKERDLLYADRLFEDILMRADITLYQRPLLETGNAEDTIKEKGIDVWLALTTYEMATLKNYDIVCLVTGDGDYVPLVEKLNTLGCRVMLVGCHAEWDYQDHHMSIRVSNDLRRKSNYVVMIDEEVMAADRERNHPFNSVLQVPRNMYSESTVDVQEIDSKFESQLDTRQKGVIVYTNVDKGYGFIQPDTGGDNYFVHITALPADGLRLGNRVAFDITAGPKGNIATAVVSIQ